MGRFTGTLFASDFDGTLADSKGEIPEPVRERIKYYISEGGLFTVCTGRTKQGFHFYDKSIINAPVLLANGIMAYDYEKESTVFGYTVSLEDSSIVSLIAKEFPDICIEMYSDDFRTYAININERSFHHFTRQNISWTNVGDVSQTRPPFVKIMLSAGRERASDLQSYLDTVIHRFDLKYIPSTGEYVEIINRNAGKGKGLLELAGLLGIGKESVYSAGDGENDLDMLAASGLCFVPSNACPAAKALPHIDVVSNDEGAIADAIDRIPLRSE